jgi:dTDP-4-dehydrorhamnose 3,5-epimerase
MQIEKTKFKDLIVLNPTVYGDERGMFFETYRDYVLNHALGFNVKFVQENQSISKKFVFRGYHFQKGDFAQAKLVRVVKGSALDVVIDIRKNEPTYGQHHMEFLSDNNRKLMFVPRGFAHGFLSLSDDTIFEYKCDNYYSKENEGGINPLDESLGIDLSINSNVHKENFIIHERDLLFSNFNSL